MKTEIIDVSPTRKEIKIEIEPEDVRGEFERVSAEYARHAAVPGFRKGHAPVTVIRTRFKKEIRGDVLQKVVPDVVSRAIEESGLSVIGQPELHLDNEGLDKFGKEPFSLHAHVEVLPEVTLGEYKGLEAARRTRPVTEEKVARVIEDLRESSASLQPVEDRGAEAGDTVTVNFKGRYIEPPSEEDINAEEVDVVLGAEGVLQEFTDNLTGAHADDVKTFTVKYPEDFNAKGLAGNEIEYTATVTAVRRKEVPALDDEWVKSLGEEEVDSVEKLRERVRENLTKHSAHEAEQRLRNEVLAKLVAAHQFEVPETLVNYQANQFFQNTVRDLIRRGIDPRGPEFNWDALREMAHTRAGEDLRGSLLLERIADAESIEVTDEEVETEINEMVEASGQPVEQVRAALTKDGGERSIADRLRNRKALDLLVSQANVRDEVWTDEEKQTEEATSEAEAQSPGA